MIYIQNNLFDFIEWFPSKLKTACELLKMYHKNKFKFAKCMFQQFIYYYEILGYVNEMIMFPEFDLESIPSKFCGKELTILKIK
jgi:hypothetical protein